MKPIFHVFLEKSNTNGLSGYLWKNGGIYTTYHEATKMTPYELVYGQQPPSMVF